MKRIFALQPFFILLLPVFFILNGYNDYFGFFPFSFVLKNFLAVSVCILIIYLLGRWIYRQTNKAIVFFFFISLFLIFFGSAFDTWKTIAPAHFLTSYYFIIPVSVIAILIFSIWLKRYPKKLERLFTYLNIVFWVLFFFEAGRLISLKIKTKQEDLLIDSRFSAYKSFQPSGQISDTAKPDVFLLVFDAMPSSKAMEEDLGFRNQTLDTFFAKNNFYVAENAKSNYDLTILSVSSMLNMDYVQEEEIKKGTGINLYYRATSSLLDNSLVRILKKENYAVHQYQPLTIFHNKDWKGNLIFGKMLTMNYFYKTFPGRLWRDLGWNIFRLPFLKSFAESNYNREATEKKDDILLAEKLIQSSCSKSGEPKFVYAHFMLPHVPFVFTDTGGIHPFDSNKISDKQRLTDQLNFSSLKIKQVVSYILEHNKKNTIIIVQGDHGYTSSKSNMHADFGFQNLNAIYFPDANYQQLYTSLSPVNSFRIILNKYFASKLPLLKDSSIMNKISKEDWEK